MKQLETLAARVGENHWLCLSEGFDGWTFLIWGKYPLSKDFGKISKTEATEAASTAAKEHFGKHGLEREVAEMSELSWRVAVRYTAA